MGQDYCATTARWPNQGYSTKWTNKPWTDVGTSLVGRYHANDYDGGGDDSMYDRSRKRSSTYSCGAGQPYCSRNGGTARRPSFDNEYNGDAYCSRWTQPYSNQCS